jgi:site-specific DNA-adenine methylase
MNQAVGRRPRNYLGSKAASGVFKAIIAQMPPHETYIETHVGSGIVLREKPTCERSIAIDLDASVFERFGKAFSKANAECHVGDAVAFLEAFDFASAGRVLIYADPPYLASTRTSKHPRDRYRHEYTDADHVRLLAVLAKVPASVILSGYPSAMYDAQLQGWRTRQFQVATLGGVRTEKVWMNFDAGPVHWSSFAGENFTDRQRIKRKAERWASNYAELPPGEQLAVLAAMLATHERSDEPDEL